MNSEQKLGLAEIMRALEFYAKESNWRTRGHPQIDATDTRVNYDYGATARRVLLKTKDLFAE